MEYYPSFTPLVNAGNTQPLLNQANQAYQRPNNEFVIATQTTFGKYQDALGSSAITSVNFAINDRPYSPDNWINTNTTSSTGGNGLDRNGFPYQESFCQYGNPLVHENRCRGAALFSTDLEYLNKDQSVLAGVNTTMVKPFELLLEYQQSSQTDYPNKAGSIATQYQGLSELVPWAWFDFVWAVNTNGITVVGRS